MLLRGRIWKLISSGVAIRGIAYVSKVFVRPSERSASKYFVNYWLVVYSVYSFLVYAVHITDNDNSRGNFVLQFYNVILYNEHILYISIYIYMPDGYITSRCILFDIHPRGILFNVV